MRDYKSDYKDIKDTEYLHAFQISDFNSIDELSKYIEKLSELNCGVFINSEHSNFAQGVLLHIFDKNTCDTTIVTEMLLKRNLSQQSEEKAE